MSNPFESTMLHRRRIAEIRMLASGSDLDMIRLLQQNLCLLLGHIEWLEDQNRKLEKITDAVGTSRLIKPGDPVIVKAETWLQEGRGLFSKMVRQEREIHGTLIRLDDVPF